MPLPAARSRFLAILLGVLQMAQPGWAEMIRFGYGGSIHGGATWEIRPDDSVIFAAYQAEGAVTLQKDWIWDNKDIRSGHLTFAIPGAYARASDVMLKRIAKAKLGPAPAYQSNCTDAGYFIVEVDIPELTYSAMVDACITSTGDRVPGQVLRHYRALKAATDEIHDAVRLGTLF